MTDLDKLLQMASADNVSDELLAAYIDGNTTAEENEMIQASMPVEDLDDIKEIAQDSLSFEEQLHFYDGDYGYWELGIPPVLDINDESIHINEASMEREIYGYEPNYELDKFDPSIFQGYDNTCAIRAQEIVMRDYGIRIPKEQLVQYATDNGWFDPDPDTGGTDKQSVGNILDANGLSTTRSDGASIDDIIEELKAGHRVIVSVDADELWVKNEPNVFKKLFGHAKNYVNDSVQNFLGMEGANHALIVAGVNVNPLNQEDIKVVLIDSGTGDVCIEYELKDFQNAWADGHCRMIATNIPAPFQYNYHTHELEPSGFDPTEALANIHVDEYFTNIFPTNYAEQMLASSSPIYTESNPLDWDSDDSVLSNNLHPLLGMQSHQPFKCTESLVEGNSMLGGQHLDSPFSSPFEDYKIDERTEIDESYEDEKCDEDGDGEDIENEYDSENIEMS